MKPTILVLLVLALGLGAALAGCRRQTPEPGKATYQQISQEEAKRRMALSDGHLVVDVRRQEEYDAGHIPGAILVPNESIGDRRPEALPDPDQILLVYCRTGNRSKQAAQKLADLGYTQVYEFGGITTWDGEITTEPTPTEPAPAPTGEPATLVFPSFDGGGPVFALRAEDEGLLSWTQARDYGGEDPSQIDGAAYWVTFTFTGLRPGTTELVVEERSPIAGNYDRHYTARVDEALRVSLEPGEVRALDAPEGEAAVPLLAVACGDRVFYAVLEDNSSAQALTEALEAGEITVEMADYGDFEKVGPLPWSLPQNDERITTAPGDVILYQGNQITVYYGENTWSFTRLGRIPDVTRGPCWRPWGAGTRRSGSGSNGRKGNDSGPEGQWPPLAMGDGSCGRGEI